MNITNCMVAQSGGPTVAINSSLAGVIYGVYKSNLYNTVYGSVNGILGILNNRILNLTESICGKEGNLERLKHTPAMYLGSCRHKLPDYHEDTTVYEQIFACFEQYNIGAFFYIGGNDSMDTVMKLSAYAHKIGSPIRIIGVPKTIDNDLMVTDHTPGFGSAAKYIASTILEISHDTYIYPVKSVTIVEIMGRDAGWLTAASALARNSYNTAPHLIYLPEVSFSKEQFIKDVRKLLETRDNVIIAVSEGIRDANGNYISAGAADTFGHNQLSGAGKVLEHLVKNNINVKVRSVEINVLQRCAAHLASATDLNEAFESGCEAVRLAEQGITASMVIINRTSDSPYTVEYGHVRICDVANEAKSVPTEWISDSGNDIKDELKNYIRPLILGEVPTQFEDGIPAYISAERLKP